MKEHQTTKYYWGIGLENETYMQFEESATVSGEFMQTKVGCERYSIDYRTCYKAGSIAPLLTTAFFKDKDYLVSRMINSHSLDKLDVNFQHKTLPLAKKTPEEEDGDILENAPVENPNFLGATILECFLEHQPYNIHSMVTQKNTPMRSVNFDGDSIEFVTMYFENRTILDSCDELKTTKKLFLDKLNESAVLPEKLQFPDYNIGFNLFMSNQENFVLFNNGTYHFHLTLPTQTENSRIVDYVNFEKIHSNAIYLLQWFEPFFIATLGSPDIMGVINEKYELGKIYALGSMRNAMSRYTGVGTYHTSMPKGKILTTKIEDFRKLLRFEKEENIWWRDQIEMEMEYDLLTDIGLDFNLEKMYQSGFEFRSFDEFPSNYLNDVLHAIVLISEHSLHLPEVPWAHDSVEWNNLVFRSLKSGYRAEILASEKQVLFDLLQLLDPSNEQLKVEFDTLTLLDECYFKIMEVLHTKYTDNNVCVDAMFGEKPLSAPKWDNFNKFQVEQHLKQINPLL